MKVSKNINFKDGDEADIYNDPVTFKNVITFDSAVTLKGSLDVVSGSVTFSGSPPVTISANQTIDGIKTFTNPISGNISGNANTVTDGVYLSANQTISGIKTFSHVVIPTSQPSGTLVDGTIWLT